MKNNHLLKVAGFGVDFSYDVVKIDNVLVRETICTITDLSNEYVITVARVGCHSGDIFSKSTGRKKSLARALTSPILQERWGRGYHGFKKALWQAYFTRSGKTPQEAKYQ